MRPLLPYIRPVAMLCICLFPFSSAAQLELEVAGGPSGSWLKLEPGDHGSAGGHLNVAWRPLGKGAFRFGVIGRGGRHQNIEPRFEVTTPVQSNNPSTPGQLTDFLRRRAPEGTPDKWLPKWHVIAGATASFGRAYFNWYPVARYPVGIPENAKACKAHGGQTGDAEFILLARTEAEPALHGSGELACPVRTQRIFQPLRFGAGVQAIGPAPGTPGWVGTFGVDYFRGSLAYTHFSGPVDRVAKKEYKTFIWVASFGYRF